MSKVRIVGAISSVKSITLYMHDGKELTLPTDSYRTKAIMDKVVKPLAAGGYVDLDLEAYSVEQRIEERTNGVVRFFRRVKQVLGLGETVGPIVIGNTSIHSNEELVAVVAGKEIPGVEKIAAQMERAAYGKDAKGFQRFMERIASVIDDRGHSIQELLSFMQKGDLPIADDGTIIAYKSLYKRDDHFVDPHTCRVRQKVGSFVSMDPKLVDPSRRQECSTGLHVGRRDYMRGFSGDSMMIIKIRPEDVIAVPLREPSKMRVCGYHIVAQLNDAGRSLVMQNKPMTSDAESAELLGSVVVGNHVAVLETVVVGGPNGTEVTITPAIGIKSDHIENIVVEKISVKTLDDETAKITPKEIRAAATEARNAAARTGDMSAAVSAPPPAPTDVSAPLSKAEKKVVKKLAPAKTVTKVEPAVTNGNVPVWETAAAKEKLTDKQREALKVMAETGLSLRKTATMLSMSHHTINRAQEILGLKQKHNG